MSRDPDGRLFRGDDRYRADQRQAFDPVAAGAQVGLSSELSLQVWKQVQREAETDARVDPIARFRELALRLAKRGARHLSEAGRVSGTERRARQHPLHAVREVLHPRVPGRTALAEVEARRWEKLDEQVAAPAPARTTEQAAPRRVQVHAPLAARLSDLFGVNVSRTLVVVDSPQAAGSTRALTRDGEVHFRLGAYQPGTPSGDWLIAHELAHVAQQTGTARGPAGERRELEREADRAASLAMRGLAAPIGLRAQPGAAYAFDDGEAHEDVAHEHAPPTSDQHAQAAPSKDHDHEAPDHDHGAPDHTARDEAEASAVLPAEDAPPPATASGGPAPKADRPVPNVAAAKPEQAMEQLRGVRPDRIAQLFGPMRTANSADIAKQRAEQRANPAKQMSKGAAVAKPAAEKGTLAAPPAPGAATAATPATAANAHGASHPFEPKAPGTAEEKQAKQADAITKREAVDQVAAQLRRSVQSWLHVSFDQRPDGADHPGAKMTEQETREMTASIDTLPTTANDVATNPGPAPQLAMHQEAQARADTARAELEKTIAAQQLLSHGDVQAPMGEDHVASTEPTEELTARPPAGGGPETAPALPTVAGAAPSEEVAIAAQEQQGAEIDAALTKASVDITAQRGKHVADEVKARVDADAQMRDLQAKADAEQDAARATAKADAANARQQWQAEIDKQGTDARKQANAKIAEGMAYLNAEEAKANTEAKKHIDDGQRKAEEEKQKGERDAADAKAKGKQKSSGAWGWIKSKAKAAVDGIKHAVSAAIDACRKAVKAVIAAAKKLAMAVIEAARKVINAAIRLIGEALIAISDVLLSAFPALKAKFQGLVRKAVAKAQAAVNKIAAGLKAAVQKALDALGNLLDKALQLLEKGINAIIDGVVSVLRAAVKAAQAAVDMLGTLAKLIKDVAAGPAAWLGKLGAAVVDGIKNHLWSAFKTTVVEWFKSKVFELLGVGGVILEVLLEGGLTREHITQMAMDALLVAIPAALIAILVEKLVSMIVPAAGAVMAIVEGLQAAWGTISRIIAALSAFVGFLLAVKTGSAGPLFAGLLAAAAVVVLDFVSNWLMKKLASAARKVGAKLKGLAEKFKAKRKAKHDAKASKAHHDEHNGAGHSDPGAPKAEDRHDNRQAEKDKKNRDILARAQRELPSKISAALRKRPGKLLFRARLAAWKLQYRLTSLQMVAQGERFKVKATVNPSTELDGGFIIDVLAMLKRIGDRLLRENPEALNRASARARDLDIDPSKAKAQRAYAPDDAEERLAVAANQKAQQPNREPRDRTLVHHGSVEEGGHVQSVHEKPGGTGERAQGDEVVRSVNPDGGASNAKKYTQLAQILEGRGVTPQQLGEALRSMSRGFGVPTSMRGSEKELGELMGLSFGTEASRDSRNPLFSMMAIEQMERGAPIASTLAQLPAEMRGHVRAAEGNRADLSGEERGHRHKQPKIDELVKRQLEQLEAWFKLQTGGREVATASTSELEKFVEDMVRRFIRSSSANLR